MNAYSLFLLLRHLWKGKTATFSLHKRKQIILHEILKGKKTNALFLKQNILSQLTHKKKKNPKFYVLVKTFFMYLVQKPT